MAEEEKRSDFLCSFFYPGPSGYLYQSQLDPYFLLLHKRCFFEIFYVTKQKNWTKLKNCNMWITIYEYKWKHSYFKTVQI